MRYFKSSENDLVYGIDDDQDFLITESMTQLTKEEEELHLNPPKTKEQLAAEERYWRDNQLVCADVEVNKLQDSKSDYSCWSGYRIALRDWPAHAMFPDSAHRPVSPGVK